MKAFLLYENGGAEKLIPGEANIPVIKPGEVLVSVKAISVNPVDAAVRQNRQTLMNIMQLHDEKPPYILGWDISGKVTETGEDSRELQGKDVFGMINFKGQGRAYADFVAAPVSQLAVKPADISYEEAAAATLAALTAWQALITNAKLQRGEKVLIHAAAGGVGHYAVQIAKHLGARVIGTASASNKDFVLELGADEFIDYSGVRFEEKVKDADVVLDSIDASNLARSVETVKTGGRVISIKAYPDDSIMSRAKEKGITLLRMMVNSNGKDMKSIASLLQDGSIKSHIAAVFPFSELPKAHLQIETKRTRGKVVVKL